MTRFLFMLLVSASLFGVNRVSAQYSCTSAVVISDGYTSSNISSPGSTGSEQWVTSVTGTCGAMVSTDFTTADAYVYSYTTGASAGESFHFAIEGPLSSTHTFASIGVFSSCSGTSLSGCVGFEEWLGSYNDTIGVCVEGLSANTTYYIVVSNASTCCSRPKNLDFKVVEFSVESSTTVLNDECATATAIDLSDPFDGSTRCSYTASSGSPSGCGTIQNDSWAKFTATSTDVEIDYDVAYCSNGNGVQFSIWSGSCGSLSLISGSCVNPAYGAGTWNISGLTIGNTYYIRTDGYAGDKCGYNLTPIAGVALTPDNDECSDAIILTCGGGNETASIILATNTGAPSGCTGGGTPDKGVWYQFTGNGQNITLSTDNAGTNFDTQINVYTGACGAFTCVGGDDDSGTGTTSLYTFGSTNATVYYIYIDGDGAAEGQFELSISCAGSSCNANAGSWD